MRTTRRDFLASLLGSASFAVGTISPSLAYASGPKPLLLLLDGISPSTPAPLLFSFIDPIVSQVVPIGCMVRTEDRSGVGLEENRELCELLVRLQRDYRGLVEVILSVSDLADPRGFFAMRRASDAQSRFHSALAPFKGTDGQCPKVLSVASAIVAKVPPVLEGVRSAGFRSALLLPSVNTTSVVWKTKDGTQQVFGGRRLSIGGATDDMGAAIRDEVARQEIAVLVASLPEDTSRGQDGFFRAGAAIGDAVASVAASSECFLTLPSELRLRSGEAPERHLVVLVDATGPSDALKDFRSLLQKAGLPFTEVRNASEQSMRLSGGLSGTVDSVSGDPCWLVSGANSETAESYVTGAFALQVVAQPEGTPSPLACVTLDRDTDPVRSAEGLDAIIDISPQNDGRLGLDSGGVLRIAVCEVHDDKPPARRVEALRDDLAQRLDLAEDAVLLVRSGAIARPADREALAGILSEFAATPGLAVVNLDQHVRTLTAADEPLRLTKIARRVPVRDASVQPDAAEREKLLEDARLAWSFFDRLSNPKTGLAPATAWMEGNTVETYGFATMWDIGTQILATISAHSIGLVDTGEFGTRIGKILDHIEDGRFEKLRLPKGVTSTTGTAPGIDTYNASDTARLLTALKILDGYTENEFPVPGIVSRWDLDKTFRNGVPQTAQGSRLASAFLSNYAGYISRAFGLWGFETSAPYPLMLTGLGLDAEIEILHEVADRGPVGAEPHLLEAVELGFSPIAKATSEALFAAQIEAYRATGKLVCVSEVPVDREPWFVYQGYQIGDVQEHWTYDTLDESPLYKTRGFRRAVDQVSSKAAYLWHATRPGEYSDLLIRHVRKSAKGFSLGFAPGVFSASGRAEQNYADANTNGVILQAIAYKQNGGKPAIEWGRARAASE